MQIAELEFKEIRLMDIVRALSEDTQRNIIVTPEAAETKVTIFLKNVTLEEAIKSICRINQLWYRYDKEGKGTFRIMTKEEYSKDLVVGQDEAIKVFNLRNPNVIAIASAIEDLYGARVQVSYGSGITSASESGNSSGGGNNRGRSQGGGNNRRFGGRNNSGNNRGNSRGSAANTQAIQNPQNALLKDLSIEQLALLSNQGNQLDQTNLVSIAGAQTLIFVTVNIEHNLLIVKTSDQSILNSIGELVKQLDRPQTQVMLEMKIIDIKVGEDFSSLFNFEITSDKLTGSSTNPILLGGAAAFSGGGSLVYEFISNNIKANIELLEQNNRINVISNPMLVASNHRPADLFVGEERIMVRGYSIDTVDTLNTTRTITTPETELEEIGTTLKITPHINADGSIHIALEQESATLNIGAASIPVTTGQGEVLELPIDTISTARLKGEIFAKHGYTVAVGGLIRDSFARNRRKVPFFADIPLIGNIFRSTQDEESKSELVLMITPYILTQGEKAEGLDPTHKYHQSNERALKSQTLPESSQEAIQFPVCGDYCAPSNLRWSDL
ncbi:MAG: general secretion pathway protein GspD [Methyloprofundus sp.]|nr:general secretion pathway protein GspD [Methyloprofundus sp.]